MTAQTLSQTMPKRFSECADLLHERAMAQTGLTDFGDSDYREGLAAILAAVDDIGTLDPQSSAGILGQVGIPLHGRLFLEQGLKDAPNSQLVAPPAPLIIVGAPRSGTTALHQLLAVDEKFQCLESWLGRFPMPRPPRASWDRNPIYRREKTDFDAKLAINPELRAMHAVAPDEVDECIVPMAQSYVSNMFGSTLRIPNYDTWFFSRSMTPSLKRYESLLRLVGQGDGRPWLLKNPSHIMILDEILQVFPAARIVHIHRDPLSTVPSAASLLYRLSKRLTDTADPSYNGQRELKVWSRVLPEALAAAKRHPDRIIAVREADLRASPIALAEQIYRFAGLEWDQSLEERLARWMQANPAGKHGAHVYTADQFGLSEAVLREAFADYRQEMGFV